MTRLAPSQLTEGRNERTASQPTAPETRPAIRLRVCLGTCASSVISDERRIVSLRFADCTAGRAQEEFGAASGDSVMRGQPVDVLSGHAGGIQRGVWRFPVTLPARRDGAIPRHHEFGVAPGDSRPHRGSALGDGRLSGKGPIPVTAGTRPPHDQRVALTASSPVAALHRSPRRCPL